MLLGWMWRLVLLLDVVMVCLVVSSLVGGPLRLLEDGIG